MQGIYTYIPETNYAPRQYSVAAILLLLFIVLISFLPVLSLLNYISTSRIMCAVPNMAFFSGFIVINPSAWSDGHCPHAARSHSFVYISTS